MSENPHERLRCLERQAETLGIEGLFNRYGGLTPEDMAQELWKLGYLKIPTVEELVAAIEREIEARSSKE